MTNDNRVPAGVPTGGEFATGARAENDDLQTGILNVGLMLNGTKLTPEDAEQALSFRDDDRAMAIELLMDQDEMVQERVHRKPSEKDAYSISTGAVRDAKGDMANAKRLFERRLAVLSGQMASTEALLAARTYQQQASYQQARAVVHSILERFPDAQKITLLPGENYSERRWLVLSRKNGFTKVLPAHHIGADDNRVDLRDPECLARLCVGYDIATNRAKGMEVNDLGHLEAAVFDLDKFSLTDDE